MEFGVFAQLFVPHVRARRRPGRGAQAHHPQRRDRQGRRPARLQVRVVPAAPLPRRVQPHARARGVPVVLRRPDRAGPPRLGDLQHHAGGQQAAAHRRERRPARPPHAQPLRVRHRPGLVHDRGPRLRHRERRHHQGHVAGDDPRDPEDVEGRHVQLRRHVLPHARAQGVPEAPRPAAPGDVGRRRLPRHLHRGRRARPRRVLLLHRPTDRHGAARARPTRPPSPTPRRSATTPTTTSWASPTCSAWRTARRPSRSRPTWA